MGVYIKGLEMPKKMYQLQVLRIYERIPVSCVLYNI